MKIPDEMYQLAKELGTDILSLPTIEVEKEILEMVLQYLEKNSYTNPVLIVDENTYEAAGKKLNQILVRGGLKTKINLLKANQHNQVIADEPTLLQMLIETPQNIDILIAVGSGTIHDITRFVGYKMNIPFISVPTAASVDGFTSKGAPLIMNGVKQTIQTTSPVAVFADIEILKKAPKEMTAAGFGDILGKYTSLLDWQISKIIGEEPYNQRAADMTNKSLESCVENVSKIADGDDEGMKILMQSLIESGLVMLLLDFSRSASGGEHHLSHYWEMDLLKKDAKQLLHGEKVGVATIVIIDLYKQAFREINPNAITSNENYIQLLRENKNLIQALIDQLPSTDEIQKLLRKVGGPATTEDLSLDNQLVARSLNDAFHLRDRCTGLLLINLLKKDTIQYPLEDLYTTELR